MRRSRVLSFLAALLALLLIVGPNLFPSHVRAAAGFPLDLGKVGQGELLTSVNGAVAIRGGTKLDAYQLVASDGSITDEMLLNASIASTGVSAVDPANGTLFMSVFDANGVASVAAFSGNSQLWSTQLTSLCAASGQTLILNPEALVLAADGGVYVTSSQLCASSNVYFLSKLDRANGSLVFQQQLQGYPAWLGVYNSGVIVQIQHVALQYVGFDGSLLASDPIDLSSDYTELARANTVDGKVAVIFWKYPGGDGFCPSGWNGQYVTRIVEYSPSGMMFNYVPASCEYLMPTAITSDGMTVMAGYDANQTPQLVELDPTGNLLKTVALTNDTNKYTNVTADTNGHVMLAYHDQQNGDQPGYEFELLDSNLNLLSRYNTLQIDPSGQTDFENLQYALAPGRLYIAVDSCSKFGCSNTTPRFLYAQDMAGLGIDYPRGALSFSGQPTPTPQQCPTLQFVGVRGSGETMSDEGGLGEVVSAIRSEIGLRMKGKSIGVYALDYPAVPVLEGGVSNYGSEYSVSITAGDDRLLPYLNRFSEVCPSTYIVLVGYSQGAHVAGNVYEMMTNEVRRHIGALVLLGDPLFNPHSPAVDVGSYSKKLSGIFTGIVNHVRQFVPEFAVRVRSYCMFRDPVCSYSLANLATCTLPLTCTHLQYVTQGWTKNAGDWIVKELKNLPPLK